MHLWTIFVTSRKWSVLALGQACRSGGRGRLRVGQCRLELPLWDSGLPFAQRGGATLRPAGRIILFLVFVLTQATWS